MTDIEQKALVERLYKPIKLARSCPVCGKKTKSSFKTVMCCGRPMK